MTGVSELRATAYIGGEAIPCTEARVVMDEGWSPRVSAEVVIPWTSERAAALDPRTPPVVVRTNRATDPQGRTAVTPSGTVVAFQARWYGPGGAGTVASITGATDGPGGLTSYRRMTITTAPTGAGEVGFNHTGGNSSNGAVAQTSGYPVTPGQIYALASWFRVGAGSGHVARMHIMYRRADGTVVSINTLESQAITVGEWTRISTVITIPAETVYLGWSTSLTTGTLPIGATIDGTGALLELAASVGSYFSGATPDGAWTDYEWTGTPEASTSTATTSAPPPRLSIRIARHWYGSLTLDDLSELLEGLTLDDLSTIFGGLTLDDLTAAWQQEWESGAQAPDVLTADLGIRGRRIDYATGTITVRAASDELLAQDAHALVTRPEEPLPTRVLALLAAGSVPVLAYDLSDGDIYIGIPAEVIPWTQSMWDAAEATCASVGMRLWCDESRTWRVGFVDAAPTVTADLPRVSGCDDDTDRDSDWADVLVVVGTGINDEGLPITDTRTWPDPVPAGSHKVHVENIDYGQVGVGLPMPTDEEMAARHAALASRDRVLTVTAPADPTIRPGFALTTGAPSLPAMGAVVSRVEWAIPDDTMTLTTRSTTEG